MKFRTRAEEGRGEGVEGREGEKKGRKKPQRTSVVLGWRWRGEREGGGGEGGNGIFGEKKTPPRVEGGGGREVGFIWGLPRGCGDTAPSVFCNTYVIILSIKSHIARLPICSW